MLLTLTVAEIASRATPEIAVQSVNTGQYFLPPYGSPRDRFGFDSSKPLADYDVAQLHAGWYSDWGASLDPDHPDQLVYVQLIDVHAGADPYDPDLVRLRPDKATIAKIAAAHPGSLWLMGNEPDSFYQGDPILPDVYAIVYHDAYEYIKGLDPTALIANGGIVQPTPCRLEYLDMVWDTYLATFGEPMPVDVWNTHAFVLREVYESWGASTPPGVDPSCGIDYAVDDGDNMEIFGENIRALRAWMKEKGYQNKPLILTEYGILWPQWFAPQFTPARVSHFMTRTFDFFLHTMDPDLGYPADDYRLVQAWAWYSLSDDEYYNGYLFQSGSKALSPMGETYAGYTAALGDAPYVDLSARLVAAWPSFGPTSSGAGSAGPLTFTVSMTGSIGNLGKLPATDVLARLQIISGKDGTAIFGRDAVYTVPSRFDGIVLLPPLTATLETQGRHELRLTVDPEDQIEEPRTWNNVATTTLDLRPDLSPVDLAYQLTGPVLQSGTLVLTATVRNQGDWPSSAVTGTVRLGEISGGTLDVYELFSVPPLNAGDQFQIGMTLPWPVPEQELYYVVLKVDEADVLAEQNEGNNEFELVIPVALSTTLEPDATTVLTSVSGEIEWIFPAGAVSEPTQLLFTPLWPAHWQTGPLKTSNTAFSLTVVSEQSPVPFTFGRPVTVTWRYLDADVSTLDEAFLRLFVQAGDGGWREASCRPYQRQADQNQLAVAIFRTGRFVFANRYDLFLPQMAHATPQQGLDEAPAQSMPADRTVVPGSDLPRTPLRLP